MSEANKPAFPVSELPKQYQPKLEWGLTKREYFAAMALQGLLADPEYRGDAAPEAVLFADDLIKALGAERAKEN